MAVAASAPRVGLVGAALLDILPRSDTPARPWKVYALFHGPLPPWSVPSSNSNSNPVVHLHLDLADPAAVAQALAALTDITHVFSLVSVHVCLQTGRKLFVNPFEPQSGISAAIVAMRPYPEDVLLDALGSSMESSSSAAAITWSVHRPATVFGFSPRGESNVVASLCVYAAICCKEGAALRWPGSRDAFAEHALWACLLLSRQEFPKTNIHFQI